MKSQKQIQDKIAKMMQHHNRYGQQTQIRQKTKQEHDGGQCITSYENNGSGKSSLYLDKVSGDNIHKKILQYKQENITFKLKEYHAFCLFIFDRGKEAGQEVLKKKIISMFKTRRKFHIDEKKRQRIIKAVEELK